MAAIRKSRGTVGPGSMDVGKNMPLDVVDKRLKDFRIFYHGERPKTMLPQSREHYTQIMIEVTDDDREPTPGAVLPPRLLSGGRSARARFGLPVRAALSKPS
jgi:hypothetical protein